MPEYATKEELESKADLDEDGKLDPEQVPLAVVSVIGAEPTDQAIRTEEGWAGLAPTTINPCDPAFGASGSGIAPDTAGLKAALAAAVSSGGGAVQLGPGVYPIDEYIDVPANVNLLGIGSGAVVIKCLNSGSGLRFGNGNTSEPSKMTRGGLSGGFTLSGNEVATRGVQIRSVQRAFADMYIEKVNGDGLLVEASQNCLFHSITIERCAANGVVWDYGCASNIFLRLEIYGCSKWALVSRATNEEAFAAPEPRHNEVLSGVFEHPGTTVGGGVIGEGEGLVNFEAGVNNVLTVTLSAVASTIAMPLVKTSKAKSFAQSAKNRLQNCALQGIVTLTSGIRIGKESTLQIGGRLVLNAIKVGWEISDNGKVEVESSPEYSEVTTEFANYEGGSSTFNSLVFQILTNMRVRNTAPAANANPLYEVLVSGDTRGRFTINSSGNLQFGSGALPPDITVRRAAGVLLVEGKFAVTEGLQAVAAAETLTPSNYCRLLTVSGNTEIKKITAGLAGQQIVLKFAGTPTVKDGENLKLAGDFVATADDTLGLICDGTNWYETGRSVN